MCKNFLSLDISLEIGFFIRRNSNLGSSNYIARVEFHDDINSLADFVSIMSTNHTQQGNSPAVQYFRAFSFKDNSGWTPGGSAWYEGVCGFRNLAVDTRYSVSGWVLMHAGDSSAVYVGNISGMNGEYSVYWKDIKDAYIKQYDSINTEALEIYHATPFIDFHFNKSSADYTSRIIEQTSGTLTITGKLKVNSTIFQGGTAVSLSGHTHDDRYFTESEINTKFSNYAKSSYKIQSVSFGQKTIDAGLGTMTTLTAPSVSGYTVVGIVGTNSQNNNVAITQFYLSGTTVRLDLRNYTNTSVTCTPTANLLYLKTS